MSESYKDKLYGSGYFEPDRHVVVFFLLFLVFFQPSAYALPGQTFYIWRDLLYVVSAGATAYYILHFKISFRWTAFCLFALFMVIVSSEIAESDRSLLSLVCSFLVIIGFISLVESGLSMNRKAALYGFILAGALMLLAHFVSFLIFKDVEGAMRYGYINDALGMTTPTQGRWYFLTYDNNSIFYFLPLLAVTGYCSIEYSKKMLLPFCVMLICVLGMYVIDYTVTALISLVCFVVITAMLLLILRSKHKLMRYVWLVAAACGITFCVLIVPLTIGDQIFQVTSVLNKASTATGRDEIWMRALEVFQDNPVFGIGLNSSGTTAILIGQSHVHNIVLELLFSGGIVCLVLFIAALYSCRPNGSSYLSGKRARELCVMTAAIFAFFIAAGLDWLYYNPIPYIIFLLSSYITKDASETKMFPLYSIEI